MSTMALRPCASSANVGEIGIFREVLSQGGRVVCLPSVVERFVEKALDQFLIRRDSFLPKC